MPDGRFDLAYVVRANDYRGQRDVQLEWVDARGESQAPPRLHVPERKTQVVDYRGEINPQELLERLRAQADVQVWSEAGARAAVAGQDRYELGPSRGLAVWTMPPGLDELRAALEAVSPETVYLFGVDPGMDRPAQFLERLLGLVKHALNAGDGGVRVSTLAAATAQREAAVRAGLAWLAARGHVAVLGEDGDEMHLAAGDRTPRADLSRITARLKALLEETAAYRAHFARADKDTLVTLA